MPKDKNPFAEWVERVFNIQPETIPYFYDQDRSLWSKEVAPEVTFAHMIELFEHPQPILEPFTDEQQKWGLYYIVANSPTQADYLSLEKSFQHRCIHSFDNLFKDFFEVKCWPDPFDMENRKSVNAACYRWWMEISFNCTPDNSAYYEIDMEFLDVLNHILRLPSDACRESAIYGVARWAISYPNESNAVIDEFLARTPDLRWELVILAERARHGFTISTQERQQMINDIERAFANTVYPGDDNITNHDHCSECAEIAQAFRGKTWQELRDVAFLRYHESALSLFKPLAFRYFFPAFMRAVLIDAETADVIWDGIDFHLTPPDGYDPELQTRANLTEDSDIGYFVVRVSGFTASQKAVIERYLELLARRESHIMPEYELKRQRAFEFWKSYKG